MAVKPPIGVIPKAFYTEMCSSSRIKDLSRAITDYIAAGLPVKPEWLEEYNELIYLVDEKIPEQSIH
jgi:hypothetical protein